MSKWHHQLESLGAGLMIGIIFLELLPQITVGESHLGFYIYIPLVVGFTVIALVEKIIYKTILNKNPITPKAPKQSEEATITKDLEYEKELADIDCIVPEYHAVFEGVALITHGLVLGILITVVFNEETFNTSWLLLLFVLLPIFIRSFTLAFSAEQILEDIQGRKKKVVRYLSLITPFVGASLGIIFVYVHSPIALFTVFAFVLGLVLYLVVRDMIPLGKKGKPVFFLIGIIITLGTFLISELLISV
jgi:zinc transporter ZupT